MLFCSKPVIVTPEAAHGLPEDFKDFVYVEKDEIGFLKVIKKFLEKNTENKTNARIIKEYLGKSKTMRDVIDSVLGKKSLNIKKEG